MSDVNRAIRFSMLIERLEIMEQTERNESDLRLLAGLKLQIKHHIESIIDPTGA